MKSRPNVPAARLFALALAIGTAGGCNADVAPIHSAPLPLTFQAPQRQVTLVPESAGLLRMRLGDITGGAVPADVIDRSADALAGDPAWREGELIYFDLDGYHYRLRLLRLDQRLLGEDHAVIEFARASEQEVADRQPPAAEAQIEALLRAVDASGMTFIRNGARHDSREAADHLRSKFNSARGEIRSVEEFITRIGSRSSTSGEDYFVEHADGSREPAGEWLRRLARDAASPAH